MLLGSAIQEYLEKRLTWKIIAYITTGKLHRAFRLSMEHIPDVGLEDIQEDDENQREENIESEHEVIDEDGSKHVTVNQDGVISDETDSESFSKSRNLNVRDSAFVKGFKS